jgi:hypothetical protein
MCCPGTAAVVLKVIEAVPPAPTMECIRPDAVRQRSKSRATSNIPKLDIAPLFARLYSIMLIKDGSFQ